MSSNGVKVKQQLFCILNVLIKMEKEDLFFLCSPNKPHQHDII